MKELGLLKFSDLYEQQCLMLTHDCFYHRAPQMIAERISMPNIDYNLRGQAQNPLDLRLPNCKSRAATSSFSAKAPAFWNNTPVELRKIDQKPLFKRNLKKSILNRYDHKTDCNNPRCRDHRHHS